MPKVLYRKYRSRSFDEVLGQHHITETLQKALKNGQLSHAYLFTGPRGVGKTSVARILAYAVNGINYEDGGSHLDIIEIDGASNRRIEEIRDLRDKARILPSSGKYKVYIIDEVHMLTREAFNALLKTLEEPPAHCIFILATTEAHKLPQTIISRTQRFSFKPIDSPTLVQHLLSIAKKEGIKIDQPALELIALHGDGSFRDSLSLLDQLSALNVKIDEPLVQSTLGVAPRSMIDSLVVALRSGDSSLALAQLQKAKEAGVNPASLAKDLSTQLRADLVNGPANEYLVPLLRELLEVPISISPQDRLEIAVLGAIKPIPSFAMSTPPPSTETQPDSKPLPSKPLKISPKVKPSNPTRAITALEWAKLQSEVKKLDSAVGLALKHAVPQRDGQTLHLIFNFALYKNKVASASGKIAVAEAASQVLGDELKIEYLVDKQAFANAKNASASDRQSIQTINNIFGGGEMVESSIS